MAPFSSSPYLYLTMCNPIDNVTDVKHIIKDILAHICDDTLQKKAYDSIDFTLTHNDDDNRKGFGNLLMRLSAESTPHMMLRNVLLVQPDSFSPIRQTLDSWACPPYLPPPSPAEAGPSSLLSRVSTSQSPELVAHKVKQRWQAAKPTKEGQRKPQIPILIISPQFSINSPHTAHDNRYQKAHEN